jgi:hypothetical protein
MDNVQVYTWVSLHPLDKWGFVDTQCFTSWMVFLTQASSTQKSNEILKKLIFDNFTLSHYLHYLFSNLRPGMSCTVTNEYVF